MIKSRNRLLSFLLVVVTLLGLNVTAYAAMDDTGFSDVAANAWYADAVEYVQENGLMSGTSPLEFSPESNTSRAMLATILYRASGSPAVAATTTFLDVGAGSWYVNAASWAAANGMITGDADGSFGGNDPVTREQIATILWRYAGSPSTETGEDFADEAAISSYAATAVDWAQANGIVNGKSGNVFDPSGNATRAQVATILRNYLTMESIEEQPEGSNKTLVIYFSMPETTSATNMTTDEDQSVVVIGGEVLGNTQYMAQVIAEHMNADIFRIEPETQYPTDHTILVAQALEEQNQNYRPDLLSTVANLDEYDTIFFGYPIWWSDFPMIIYSFFDAHDFSGKTIIPFNTHGGSGFSGTVSTISQLEPNATVSSNGLSISRNRIQDARTEIIDWLDGLGLS